jgi:hypothetical protein
MAIAYARDAEHCRVKRKRENDGEEKQSDSMIHVVFMRRGEAQREDALGVVRER